ncbi:hypothetical protein QR680_005075 [Steinernema hermaphroditum]|uniref:Uncharacterized protein n=1 Tax=Steinernema hermaphroditum TaxID=289476 RepID=A0AA39HS00_9BILA|nr:hypothetical protein QR680_005075 [Steinernema hermaphroditum]
MLATIPSEDKTRTCCNCCHIKTGTVCLGLIELVVVSLFLTGLIQQLKWKHADASFCFKRMWRDCLIFNFHHFNLTLAGDYIIGLVMIFVIASILLMFCGISSVSPRMLLPHLVIQAIGFICSAGYFFLYAWSFFYGDLYTQKRPFKLQSFVERMWLATVLLIFSAFQFYLFFTVVKCVLYLQKIRTERNRRKRQFIECSNRVRIAKENGMWRQTSWGGGFQQYKGQYDDGKQLPKKKDKPTSHVKWDLQKNTEKSLSYGIDEIVVLPVQQKTPPPESPKQKTSVEETTQTPIEGIQKSPQKHHSPVSAKKSNSPPQSPKRRHPSGSGENRKSQRTEGKTMEESTSKPVETKPTEKTSKPSAAPGSPVRRTSVDSTGPLMKPKQSVSRSTSSSGGSRRSPDKPVTSSHHHHRPSEGTSGTASAKMKSSISATPVLKKISITSSVPATFQNE